MKRGGVKRVSEFSLQRTQNPNQKKKKKKIIFFRGGGGGGGRGGLVQVIC